MVPAEMHHKSSSQDQVTVDVDVVEMVEEKAYQTSMSLPLPRSSGNPVDEGEESMLELEEGVEGHRMLSLEHSIHHLLQSRCDYLHET